MSKLRLRENAIKLREKGASYSQIKDELNVSKSTLSLWLRDMPLSKERIKELRDNNSVRIEKSRQTKLLKKQNRREDVYARIKIDFKNNNKKLFKEGFYLYWGEGTKTAEYTVALTSSDLSIIKCFIKWMKVLGVAKENLRIKLHIYSDQSETELKSYWSGETGLTKSQFYKTYQKATSRSDQTYRGTFGRGTCTVFYHDRDTYEYVMAGIRYLRESHK
jgi:hypothetical protein